MSQPLFIHKLSNPVCSLLQFFAYLVVNSTYMLLTISYCHLLNVHQNIFTKKLLTITKILL